jgi:hypothetical protein
MQGCYLCVRDNHGITMLVRYPEQSVDVVRNVIMRLSVMYLGVSATYLGTWPRPAYSNGGTR